MSTSTDMKRAERSRDPDMVNAEVAMQRAAIKARNIARKAGTAVVVMREGKIVEDREHLQEG